MLGYCGIDCDECSAYKATLKGDVKALEEVAKRYWNGAFKAEEWVCLGCGPHNRDFHATYCGQCKIRLCATAKDLQNCAACDEFETCSQLQDFIKGESEGLVRTMSLLRQNFLAKRRKASA